MLALLILSLIYYVPFRLHVAPVDIVSPRERHRPSRSNFYRMTERDILAHGPRNNIAVKIDNFNDAVARSAIGCWFRLDGSGHPLQREGSKFVSWTILALLLGRLRRCCPRCRSRSSACFHPHRLFATFPPRANTLVLTFPAFLTALHSQTTELRAGVVITASMAYIISVNASILSDTGGPCVCTVNPCTADAAYSICKDEVRRDYVTATSAMAAISSFAMGVLANLPIGLAPGLGVNAYLAYSVVGADGQGGLTTFGRAFAAVFLEGWLFFLLSVLGLRQMIGRLLPRSLALATGAGIGAYLAIIGISSAGIGVVGGDYSNLLGLGGCPDEYKDSNGFCESHILQDPRVWAGVFGGGIFTAILLMYRVRGALLWPIILVSIASWPRNSGITEFPHTPAGDIQFNFFKQVATWHSFKHLGPSNIDWSAFHSGKVWLALVTFLYTDALDTTGTLFAMSRQAGLFDDRSADFEGSSVAFLVDAVCIAIGALMNVSPCTAFIESASGITEGGRTGITGVIVSLFFFLSLFLAPIFASLPSWATGATLIAVGSFMMRNAAYISWSFVGDALPAFITIIAMPYTYSIAYGLIAGIVSWIILHILPQIITLVTFGKIPLPPGWHTDKEPYDIFLGAQERNLGALARIILPPWVLRLLRGKAKFWEMDEEEMYSYIEGRTMTLRRAQAIEEQRDLQRQAVRNQRKQSAVETQDEEAFSMHSRIEDDVKLGMDAEVKVGFSSSARRTKPKTTAPKDEIELNSR